MEVREQGDSVLPRCLSLGSTRNTLTGHSVLALQFPPDWPMENLHQVSLEKPTRRKQNKTKTKVDFWVNLKYWAEPGIGGESWMEG